MFTCVRIICETHYRSYYLGYTNTTLNTTPKHHCYFYAGTPHLVSFIYCIILHLSLMYELFCFEFMLDRYFILSYFVYMEIKLSHKSLYFYIFDDLSTQTASLCIVFSGYASGLYNSFVYFHILSFNCF